MEIAQDSRDSQANVITKAIYDISKAIVGRFQLDDLLNVTVTTLAQILHADACSVFLIDEDGILRIKAGEGYSARLVGTAEYELGEGVTGTIAKEDRIIRTTQKGRHRDLPYWKGKYDHVQLPDDREKCVSFFGAPLRVKERVIGVLKVENKKEDGKFAQAFTKQDEELLEILANIIAVAIENLRLSEEKERAWKSISARAAHKIGNQNFAIKGFLRDLEREELPQKVNSLVEDISVCAKTIDGVIAEFRLFSKPIELKKKKVSLKGEIEKVIQRYPGREGLQINLSCEPVSLSAEVDMEHLRVGLIELLDNSSKFIPGKGNIHIRIREAEEEEKSRLALQDLVAIEACDDGPGIPEELKEKIFEPFFARRSEGSGLGLNIVRGIIEAHKGIIFESGEKDKGARFIILIPKGGN